MHKGAPNPKETIEILDKLVLHKPIVLTDAEFRVKHHLGDSIAGFRRYCGKIQSFQPGGKNQKLAVDLDKLLGR